jgi:hypothetical protein
MSSIALRKETIDLLRKAIRELGEDKAYNLFSEAMAQVKSERVKPVTAVPLLSPNQVDLCKRLTSKYGYTPHELSRKLQVDKQTIINVLEGA